MLLLIAFTTGLVFILKMVMPSLYKKPTIYETKNPAECEQIIEGKILHGNRNTLSKFAARARANTRLSFAFGIDNAFTTERSEQYNSYVKMVRKHLRPDWIMIANEAKGLAATLQHSRHPQNLVCLVQSIVLKMTIKIFYEQDLSAMDDNMISFVAGEINRIWIQSKVPCQAVEWKKQHKLHQALDQLIPSCDPLDPHTNALNVILPAFETMWRVVLRCFLEVRFRGASDTNEWTAALKLYLETSGATNEYSGEGKVEIEPVSCIVREALRLYPPTRHVHRCFQFADGSSVLAVANIEGLHRDTEIWGFDAACFRPSRWASLTPECPQQKAWLPFGSSPFICPAKAEFGPKIIGILVAALVEAFCDPNFELGTENSSGQIERELFDGPLCSGRDSYKHCFITRSKQA